MSFNLGDIAGAAQVHQAEQAAPAMSDTVTSAAPEKSLSPVEFAIDTMYQKLDESASEPRAAEAGDKRTGLLGIVGRSQEMRDAETDGVYRPTDIVTEFVTAAAVQLSPEFKKSLVADFLGLPEAKKAPAARQL